MLIRTKLIEDQKRAVPRYNGLVHGTAAIVREQGIGGIYRGLFPVVSHLEFSTLQGYRYSRGADVVVRPSRWPAKAPTLLSGSQPTRPSRQVWFFWLAARHTSTSTSWADVCPILSSQSFVAGNTRPGETLPAGVTFGIGALAGIVTVYATMPLE